jgi:hypothetical protein
MEYEVLNVNKIKRYIPSTIKFNGKIDIFSTLNLIKFLVCSEDLNRGTICDMTYIKKIFSSSPDTAKHFTGNKICSSDDSVMQLIHILHFFTINNVFYKPFLPPKGKNQRSQIWRVRGPWN